MDYEEEQKIHVLYDDNGYHVAYEDTVETFKNYLQAKLFIEMLTSQIWFVEFTANDNKPQIYAGL